MRHLERLAEKRFVTALQSQKVLIILGARQIGKTTLVKKVLKDTGTRYLNLDNAVDRAQLISAASLTPADAMRLFSSPQALVIDEAQLVPETGRIVKAWYDAGLPTHFILLGSSNLNLLSAAAEPLTGRNRKVELFPLSFAEWLPSTGWYHEAMDPKLVLGHFGSQLETSLWQRITYGSYPEAILSDTTEEYLHNLIGDYALRDLLTTDLVRSAEGIVRLLTHLSATIGQEVSVNDLSSILGLSRPTITRYLELLQSSYIIFRVTPFNGKLRKEIREKPKYYFWDTGLRNALIKNFSISPLRGDAEALWENWVVAELMKENSQAGYAWDISYWRSHSGSHVPIVITRNGSTEAFFCSVTEGRSPSSRAFQGAYGTVPALLTPKNPFAVTLSHTQP